MSHTFELKLPDSIHESLIKKAKSSGLSPEELITELIKAAVEDDNKDPLEDFIGAFNSGGSDWADEHDRYIGKSAINNNARSSTERLDG